MRTASKTIALLSSISFLLLQVDGQPLATLSSSNVTATPTSTTIATSSSLNSNEISSASELSTRLAEVESYAKTGATIPFASPTSGVLYHFSGSGCPRGIKIGELCCYGDVVDGKCFANRFGDYYLDFINQTTTVDAFAGYQWYDSNIGHLTTEDEGYKIDSAQVAPRSLVLVGVMGVLATIGGWI